MSIRWRSPAHVRPGTRPPRIRSCRMSCGVAQAVPLEWTPAARNEQFSAGRLAPCRCYVGRCYVGNLYSVRLRELITRGSASVRGETLPRSVPDPSMVLEGDLAAKLPQSPNRKFGRTADTPAIARPRRVLVTMGRRALLKSCGPQTHRHLPIARSSVSHRSKPICLQRVDADDVCARSSDCPERDSGLALFKTSSAGNCLMRIKGAPHRNTKN